MAFDIDLVGISMNLDDPVDHERSQAERDERRNPVADLKVRLSNELGGADLLYSSYEHSTGSGNGGCGAFRGRQLCPS